MGDLLLKDYMPRSTRVVEEHLVARPTFPAIDAHNHLGFRTDAFGCPHIRAGDRMAGDSPDKE
jgi:hypothetical protein